MQFIEVKTAKDLLQWSHVKMKMWLSIRYCAVRTDIGRHVGHNSIDWHLELMVICSFFYLSWKRFPFSDQSAWMRKLFWESSETIFLISFIRWYCDMILSVFSLSALRITNKSLANSWLEQHLTFFQLMYVAVTLFLDSFLPLFQ